MITEYFHFKDKCRKGLLKYLAQAISSIPFIENPGILDVGCGTGVPTLALAEKLKGKIAAIDTDLNSLDVLREKVKQLNLTNRITISNNSVFDKQLENNYYDIILAEGLLNVVGFQKGFLRLKELLGEKGFMIIHDEFQNQKEKIEFMEENNCKVIDSFVLDENVWWNDYYKCLEKEITSIKNKDLLNLFTSDLQEIKMYKKNAVNFQSIYYVIEIN